MSRRTIAWPAASGLAVAVAAALALGLFWLRAGSESSAPAFSLDGQPAEVTARYHFVEQHPELISTIPCYCGCGNSLGHQSLRDCYLRPDGGGYDDHASVCYVCLEEVTDIERLVAAGEDPASIRTWIGTEYSKFGPPTSTP